MFAGALAVPTLLTGTLPSRDVMQGNHLPAARGVAEGSLDERWSSIRGCISRLGYGKIHGHPFEGALPKRQLFQCPAISRVCRAFVHLGTSKGGRIPPVRGSSDRYT